LRACIHRDECACVVSVSDVLCNKQINTSPDRSSRPSPILAPVVDHYRLNPPQPARVTEPRNTQTDLQECKGSEKHTYRPARAARERVHAGPERDDGRGGGAAAANDGGHDSGLRGGPPVCVTPIAS
jgi:hypothetical protein